MNISWEYSGDPATSTKDAVRFLLGDTVEADPQMQDEEIDYLLTLHADPTTAAIAGARALVGRYTAQAVKSKSVGDLRIEFEDRAKAFRDLAKTLSSTAASGVVPIPVATGIRRSGKEAAQDDADRVAPTITIAMDDREPIRDPKDLRLESPP